jgi:hypothetical protein
LVDGNDFYYLKNFSTTDFREIAALNLWGDNSFRYSLNGGTAAIIGIDQTLSIDYAGAAADRTLTTVERSMKYISVSNASGAVNLYHGAAPYGHQWVIYNASGFTLTFKQSAGATGISIPNGQVGIAVQGRSDCHQVSVKAE